MSTATYRRHTRDNLLVHFIEKSQVRLGACDAIGGETFEPKGIGGGNIDRTGEGYGPLCMCGVVMGMGYHYCCETTQGQDLAS